MATDVKVNLRQEGAQSFAEAFKEATSSVKALDSAVKLNSASMDSSGKSLSAFQERSKLLSEEIEKQSKVVKLAQEEQQRLTEKYGEGSTQANNYQAKVNAANTKLEQLKKSLSDNEKAMEDYSSATELAGKSLTDLLNDSKSLEEQIAKQKTAVSNAKKELDSLIKTYGEASPQVEAYRKKLQDEQKNLNDLNSTYERTENAIRAYTASSASSGRSMEDLKRISASLRDEIKRQETALKDARKELKNVEKQYGSNSKEAEEFRQKLDQTKKNLSQLRTELRENESALKSVGDASKSAGEKISSFGKKVSDIGSKLKWLSVGATAAMTGMFNSASELAENINKVQVVFDDLSGGIQDWSKTTLDAYGIAQSTSLEMISLYGDMATSMGLTTEEAAKMGKELVGRAGDLASFKNVSLEVAQSGLGAIFTGETESLKKFGIVMTEANLNAYALAEGMTKTYKEMDQAEKVMLRYQYVMNATKNAAGDFANTNDGAANSVRVAQEALKEASATLGEELIPLVLPLIQDVTELIKGINALDQGTKKLIVEGLAVTAVAGPILTVGGKIISGIGWLTGTGLPALAAKFGLAQTAGTTAMAEVSAEIATTTVAATSLLGVISAVALAAASAIAVFAKLRQEHKEYEQEVRKSELTQGMQQITEADRQYYNPEDLVSVWNGTEFEHYAKTNSISDVGYAEKNARMNGWTTDGYGGVVENNTTNNYNIDMNVQNVDDLQNLLDIADTAQLLTRMG